VAVCYTNEHELQVTATQILDDGGDVLTGIVDVRDLDRMRWFATKVVDLFGRVDVLVNNAGVMPLAFYADHEAAAEPWDRCIDINFKGVLHGIMAVRDQMIEQGRGHVVNLSSIYGNQPVVGAAVYGATKAAVNVLSESLRQESLGKIKVTNVRPTGVPGTGLAAGIVNPEAIVGIVGLNAPRFAADLAAMDSPAPPVELTDADAVTYASLAPDQLADQVIYAINQPWGVCISDITVRAAGDHYII
jgi:NADP-dependent 3-hydroxy acid dehydrogenase YdfG